MFMTIQEAAKLIAEGGPLHIAGTEALLKQLPRGNWVGGSTEYFITSEGGKVSGEYLFVTKFPYSGFSISTYDEKTISNVAKDAYDNGFSIVIVPFDSAVHRVYAEKAPEFEGMFLKNITGWVSGLNLGIPGQTPIAVNGSTGTADTDKAVALHLEVPDGKTVSVNMVNIFSQDEKSPVITFKEEGFSAKNCFVDGKETVLADYLSQNGIDIKLPLVGDYSGNGVNISFKAIENGIVNFYAPVFSGIEYRMAKSISDYEQEFHKHIKELAGVEPVFSCNCILNFLYGELEGKRIDEFAGPITFGEIAYQLVNQTLVYITVM